MASEHGVWIKLALLAGLLGPASCLAATGLPGCDDLSGLPINFKVDWETDIKPLLNSDFGPSATCNSCHNDPNVEPFLDLTDNQVDAHLKVVPGFVTPHRPEDSVLFLRINCDTPPGGGSRMPLAFNKLSAEEQGLVYDWIWQGAFGEPEGEPSPSRQILFRDGAESLR